jgi:hypothetical protein
MNFVTGKGACYRSLLGQLSLKGRPYSTGQLGKISFGMITAANEQQVNQAIKLVLDMVERMRVRIRSNTDKHLVQLDFAPNWVK